VYSNLADVSVKTEQKVKAREVIGRVFTDGNGVSLVQFQIWKDNQRLDPEEWLAKQ
jgi:septal ring factor EnvC (AmiA/AmiB activator)